MSPVTRAPKKLRTFRLSPETLRQIKELAEQQGRSEAELLAVAVDRMYHADSKSLPAILPRSTKESAL